LITQNSAVISGTFTAVVRTACAAVVPTRIPLVRGPGPAPPCGPYGVDG
jgi:hypothetical protein